MGRFIRHKQPAATRIRFQAQQTIVPGGTRGFGTIYPIEAQSRQFEDGNNYIWEDGNNYIWEGAGVQAQSYVFEDGNSHVWEDGNNRVFEIGEPTP